MSKWRYKDRYGIPGPEVDNLIKRFYTNRYVQGWGSADAFVLWCSQNGYRKGAELRKKDNSQIHGPDNSFFVNFRDALRERALKREAFNKEQVSEFCRKCSKNLGNECPGMGCAEWRDYFRNNWNQNIYFPKPKPVVLEGPMVFRYEHPDLVREGIVFEGSGRM